MLCEGDGERHQAALWRGLKIHYTLENVPLASFRWVNKYCYTEAPYTTRSESFLILPLESIVDRRTFHRNSAHKLICYITGILI